MLGLIGKKVGMTAVFDETGRQVPVTVIETAGNILSTRRPKNVMVIRRWFSVLVSKSATLESVSDRFFQETRSCSRNR